jgi:hypothetical protein
MSRTITGATLAQFQAATMTPVILAAISFTTQTLRLAIAPADIVFGGQTYLANGWLRPPTQISDSRGSRSSGVQIELSGIPSAIVSLILTGLNASQTLNLWIGAWASGAMVVDPYLAFKGTVDVPEISDDPANCRAVISYEDDLVLLERTNEIRLTHEAQQSRFSGDLGFQYVEQLESFAGWWGGKAGHPYWIRKRKLSDGPQPPIGRAR